MTERHPCIVKDFPVSERVCRVAPQERWDAGVRPRSRRAIRRRAARRRRRSPIPALLLGLALFCSGVRLGCSASAGGIPPEPDNPRAAAPAQAAPVGRAGQTPGGVLSETAGGGTPAAGAEWSLLLINRDNPLPSEFAVPELTYLKNGHAVDSRIYPALQQMMDAARAAGLEPLICSSFRTRDRQESLFSDKVRRLLLQGYDPERAEEEASVWVARPGTSEHETGLAVDIVDKSYQLLDEGQENTPVQKWLMAHCAEYGFILRYPTEKSECTGVGYEPWHYRYVGTEAASEMTEQGLCLEEYLSQTRIPS